MFQSAEGNYVIPSDAVTAGETVPASFASFFDEALETLPGSLFERATKKAAAKLVFDQGLQIFKVCRRSSRVCSSCSQGYVENRFNTDNAWMETQAVNFHDDFNLVFPQVKVDSVVEHAITARWIPVSKHMPIPGAQLSHMRAVADTHSAFFTDKVMDATVDAEPPAVLTLSNLIYEAPPQPGTSTAEIIEAMPILASTDPTRIANSRFKSDRHNDDDKLRCAEPYSRMMRDLRSASVRPIAPRRCRPCGMQRRRRRRARRRRGWTRP